MLRIQKYQHAHNTHIKVIFRRSLKLQKVAPNFSTGRSRPSEVDQMQRNTDTHRKPLIRGGKLIQPFVKPVLKLLLLKRTKLSSCMHCKASKTGYVSANS